ncbi:DUF2806 domain-containing protein [Arundinibacter roseus]|uniref:DUF2806 domain-containing protein n=1 Tax=Arundinibacter roseus TaxID=2070510 RepID=A0A4R4KAC2_9BACT|nr:DUF2806 domain-containing protein [Arundinibacter roseus]TDB63311.1 DUF2806 domain-containing protein [Arundinibacter roseus]
MKLNDILGLGKVLPIDKLIDIVSNSFGKISKSYFDKKDVDTKAYEIEKLAEARAKEMKIIATAIKANFQLTGGIEYKEEKLEISSQKVLPIEHQQTILVNPQLEDRTSERVNFQEAKKQLNIENVTTYAAEELKNEQPVTDEPVDEDWSTRFFRIVEDVSNEEMQALWGKILAGEIKQPKSYSLRTLELIRNLSKNEADIFMKVANFAVKCGNENYIFKGKDSKLLKEKYNISYRDTALLTEIGILQPGSFVNYQLFQHPANSQHIFTSGNIVIIAKIKANTPTIKMPVNVFSNAGNELLKLINSNPPMDYLTSIANSIKNENTDVKYAYILAFEGDGITHTQPLQDF